MMMDKDLTIEDFGGEVLSRDETGKPIAVYIHNKVQKPLSYLDFEQMVQILVEDYPNNMELGAQVRGYVYKYQEQQEENPDQLKLDFSKSEYNTDSIEKDRKRYNG